MISDVLADALREIDDYERRMPDVYPREGATGAKLAALKQQMRDLLRELDSPPAAERLQ